jgi:hypothetical protein
MPGALMDFTSGQTPVLIIRWLETSSSVGAKGLTLRKLICNCLTLKLQAYLNPSFGRDKRVLEFSDVANTFLHSYGNALMKCPCECRQSGFSQHSLLQKGLRGCFVQSGVHHNPRYLHPYSVEYPCQPREHLALLGLIASPL